MLVLTGSTTASDVEQLISSNTTTRRQAVAVLLVALLVLLTLLPSMGQQRSPAFDGGPITRLPRARGLASNGKPFGEFTFVRIVYDSPHSPYNYGFGGAWRVDFPEADQQLFVRGIDRVNSQVFSVQDIT